jgi:hypothetical protein
MSKRKRPGRPASENRPVRVGRHINIWIDAKIGAAVDAYIATVEPATSLTAVVELALRRYLESQGQWPPTST